MKFFKKERDAYKSIITIAGFLRFSYLRKGAKKRIKVIKEAAKNGGCALLDNENYYQALQKIHQNLNPNIYVEIGINTGESLRAVNKSTLALGIDPYPNFIPLPDMSKNIKIFAQTSDDFFAEHDFIKEFGTIDLAFIDGMHLFEFVLRDFANIERNCSGNSVIILHDTIPQDKATSDRNRTTDFWTGDVFKAVLALKKYRPDLEIKNLNISEIGLCVITGLNPSSKILRQKYERIVKEFMDMSFDDIADKKRESLNIFKAPICLKF